MADVQLQTQPMELGEAERAEMQRAAKDHGFVRLGMSVALGNNGGGPGASLDEYAKVVGVPRRVSDYSYENHGSMRLIVADYALSDEVTV